MRNTIRMVSLALAVSFAIAPLTLADARDSNFQRRSLARPPEAYAAKRLINIEWGDLGDDLGGRQNQADSSSSGNGQQSTSSSQSSSSSSTQQTTTSSTTSSQSSTQQQQQTSTTSTSSAAQQTSTTSSSSAARQTTVTETQTSSSSSSGPAASSTATAAPTTQSAFTTDAAGSTVVVTSVVDASSSATASNTAAASNSGGSSHTGLIIGVSVAGGVCVIACLIFILMRFVGKRSAFNDDDADIKWPELKHDGDAAAMQPLPARRTGGAGFDMGDEGSENGELAGAGAGLYDHGDEGSIKGGSTIGAGYGAKMSTADSFTGSTAQLTGAGAYGATNADAGYGGHGYYDHMYGNNSGDGATAHDGQYDQYGYDPQQQHYEPGQYDYNSAPQYSDYPHQQQHGGNYGYH